MVKPRAALRQTLQRWINWLWQQEGSPGMRARGVAAGVFCGCFPFFGFQILLGIGLASLVRGNHLLAAAGTWISNPFTYIPLYWFNYSVGSALLGASDGLPEWNQLNLLNLWEQGWGFSSRLLVGSSVVGGWAALILGVLAYGLFRSRQDHSAKSRDRLNHPSSAGNSNQASINQR